MARREGSLWSRTWGALAVLAFAVHLGAAVYEAAVIAPLWSLTPPESVAAWAKLDRRPDSSQLFHALAAMIAITAAMAWISGISERGWRRWWLSLSLACAGGLVLLVVMFVTPVERALFGAAAIGGRDAAGVVALTGDWVRAAAMRMAVLLVGAWASYRAQVAGVRGGLHVAVVEEDEAPSAGRRAREFSFGDEPDEEMSLGDDPGNPRERWVSSLPAGRRTAKK
jgi:hypothetical protein